MKYKAIGNKIIRYDDYESFDVALCDVPDKAIQLFEKSHFLNDVKRKYTDASRAMYQAEQLPGFKWIQL
jgi:hypothetical protein